MPYSATSYDGLFRAINKRFKQAFVDVETPTPVVLYENDGVTKQPNTVGNGVTAAAYWCRIRILPGEARIVEIGGNQTTNRIPGVCTVQFFGEYGVGDARLLEAIDRCRKLFTGRTADLVRYRSPYIVPVGRSDENGRWWQINLLIPFEADFIESTS